MISGGSAQQITPFLWFWQHYDRAIKADLSSTLLQLDGDAWLVDPTEPALKDVAILCPHGRVSGVVLTNANHARTAVALTDKMHANIYAHPAAWPALEAEGVINLREIGQLPANLAVVPIDGAPAGEIALHTCADGGTLIVGDALINMGSHGFTLLPTKYCDNQKKMRLSLRQLLDYRFERILFAHGEPVTARAHARLGELLA